MQRLAQIFIILLVFLGSLKAQMSNTMYFMERIPQSQSLNPATQPKCNFYFGYSGFGMDIGNSSLSVSNILQKGPNDSLITFLHEDADKSIFTDALKDRNTLFYNTELDIMSLGFRVKSWYFNIGLNVKNNTDFAYSKDFALLLINGFKAGDQFDFRNTGINSTSYVELGLGLSKAINEEWIVGTKFKILKGLINIDTHSDNFNFSSLRNAEGGIDLVFDANMQIDTYNPFMEELPDTGDFQPDDIKMKDKPFKDFKYFESMGFAGDFGVIYKGIEKLNLSASIIDLGYINWEKGQKLRMDMKQYTFSGVDMYKGDSLSIDFNELVDSVKDGFTLTKSSGNYSTALPLKFYLAGEYFPVRFFSLGALSLSQYYKESWYQQIMVSANIRPFKMWMLSFSYSFFDNGFSNLGIGTSIKLGPTQFYFVSDNIPFKWSSGYPVPYKATSFNFRFGLNFVVGCRGESKKNRDKPLNYDF